MIAKLAAIGSSILPETGLTVTAVSAVDAIQLGISNIPGKSLPTHKQIKSAIEFIKDAGPIPCRQASLVVSSGSRGQPGYFQLYYQTETKTGPILSIKEITDAELALKLLKTMREHFDLWGAREMTMAGLSEMEQNVINFRQQTVSQFADEVRRLGTFLTEQIERSSKAIDQRTAELEDFPAHWDPKLRIPRGQVVAAASIVSPKY